MVLNSEVESSVDEVVSFDAHIAYLYKKATNQINALKRLINFINQFYLTYIGQLFDNSKFRLLPFHMAFFSAKTGTDKIQNYPE